MQSLKISLWISAVGCLTAMPFLILPWDVIENIFLLFGVGVIPNDAITIYLFRIVCAAFGFIGIFFVILARNPLQYMPMLNLSAYGLICFGLLCLVLGSGLNMEFKLYVGDVLFGLILGPLIALLSKKEKAKTL